MKKFNNVIRLLLVVLPFSLTSCEKLESEVKDFFGIDTDKDKQEEYVDSQTAMLQKVEAITKTVGEIYMESSSAAEMKSQSSVIKGIDGVESVWADDLTVFVKIRLPVPPISITMFPFSSISTVTVIFSISLSTKIIFLSLNVYPMLFSNNSKSIKTNDT